MPGDDLLDYPYSQPHRRKQFQYVTTWDDVKELYVWPLTLILLGGSNTICMLGGDLSDYTYSQPHRKNDVDLMLGQRRRRWANIKSTAVQLFFFVLAKH